MAASSSSSTMTMTSQPVFLTTQTQYPLPTQKYMIPTTWKRYQLSQLVNKALSLDKPVPFDFLVRGEILRTSLSEWCAENGVGEEETLQIEYIESIMPPQKMSDFPHEDWVSSVSCQSKNYFLTASYDGQIRAFDYSKSLVSSSLLHPAPITSLCIISSNDEEGSYTIATSSHDLTAQISQFTIRPSSMDIDDNTTPSTSTSTSKPLASLHLHTAPVSSVSSNSNGTHLLTSSWDGLIGLWDTSIPSSDEVQEPAPNERDRKKRRKLDDSDKPRRKAPLSVLKSHTARVSKVLFAPTGNISTESNSEKKKAYSCGFDSTVRFWDTEYGVCDHTITASEKPFLDLSITPNGHSVLTTSTDRTMTLYDLRTSGLKSSAGSFLHPSTPSCVTVSTTNSHQVVTGAYDGIVRVWDLRSMKGAMATFKVWDGMKKILSVDWRNGLVGIGGEGGLEVWKVGEETA